MKRNLHFLRSFLMLSVLLHAFSARATVVPYLPALQNINGSAVDLATFYPKVGSYTLEVQGVAGTQISVAGGIFTYTPVTSGTIRFSQKNGKIIVYEGNVYKTTLTPAWNTQYPTIADATAHSDPNNLLQNSSFETTGSLVGGTNYNFGTPWVTNVTVAASGGIRIQNGTLGNVNGTFECVWRGSGNTNYFAQQLAATIKPNTTYKIIVNQLAGSNAYANFNVGLGSTVNGFEYGFVPMVLGNGKNGTWSVSLRTPATITGPVYFTFSNTATSTSSTGTDPLTQIDYLALVEGVDVLGIVGATSATFLDGTAYAPANLAVDFANGDYVDCTSEIVNPSFEVNGAAGWTNVGPFVSQTNTSFAYKAGTVYFEKWKASGNWTGLKISQKILNLPNGDYNLIAGALNQPDNTGGAFVFANAVEAVVLTAKDYKLKVTVTNNEIDLGYRVDNGGNYVATDNYRLYMLSDGSPYMTINPTALVFNPTTLVKTFEVTGGYLTGDATLVAPTGVSLDKTTLTAAEVAAGAIVTATFDNATVINNGSITITSGLLSKSISVNTSIDPVLSTSISSSRFDEVLATGSFTVSGSNLASDISITAPAGITVNPTTISKGTGAVNAVSVNITYDGTTPNISGNIVVTSGVATKNIAVVAALNSNNYTPLYSTLTNIVAEPYCNSLSTYAGWGSNSVVSDYVYSGARSIKVAGKCGGSLDYNLTGKIEGNKTYRVKAMVSTNGTGEVKIGLSGATASVITQTISTTAGQWLPLDFNFTTQATVASVNMYFNSCETQTATESFIDNWEMYDITSLVTNVNQPNNTKFNTYVADSKIVADFNLNQASAVEFSVYNTQGMLISTQKVNFNSGANHTVLNANLTTGVYIVKIAQDGKFFTQKVIK
ncbi:MAG: T9SS type A sorting domain-containing protein [Paludibacter sp.]|nr:T9SS type A sorting domain-containing protein [Paludibacter sp.]